ncbi:GNAT family N-acetyltransferase [Kitasatospora sp. NPDC008050]|uniref:GNAT family N-acetyltransferase n=1 Tax=Kitasatospora sp. NPDC008050 TaxID=3364021 RepID=UPI0036EF91E4
MTVASEFTPHDVRLMQGLAQEVFAIDPALMHAETTVGELAWSYGKDHHAKAADWRHRFWYDGDQVVGWGWIQLGKSAQLVQLVHPGRPEVLDDVLGWFGAESPGLPHVTTPCGTDTNVLARLAAHGYEVDRSAESGLLKTQLNMRSLDDLEDVPALPDGFRFRTADEVGPAAVVQGHRDAWDGSRYTEQSYEGVRVTLPYRADFHLLIEAPDGTMAASTIMWHDEKNRTAEFEPVGTHRDFRRQGLGRALLLHGMHRARAAGAARMLVACSTSPTRPAPKALYYGVGFRELNRDLPHRQVPSS